MPTHTFLTGRERTVTWTGSTAGEAFRNWGLYGEIEPIAEMSKLPSARVIVLGVTIDWESNVVTGGGFYYRDIGERVSITLPNLWGSTSQQNSRRFYAPDPYTGNINGTWQVQATLEECVQITDTLPANADDAPPTLYLRFFERLKPGSTLSASASCNGVTANISFNIPTGTTYETVAALIQPRAEIQMINAAVDVYAGDCTVTYSSVQAPVGNPNFSQTLVEPGRTRTITLTNSQAYAYAAVTNVPQSNPLPVASEGSLWGTKQASAQFRVLAMENTYPDILVASIREKKDTWTNVTLNSGAGSLNIAQRRWTIFYVLYGNPADYSINEHETVKASITSSSLQAVAEDSTATRLFGHGWLYDDVRFQHYTRHVVDTCDSLQNASRQWASVQDCTLSASGGNIIVTPTGNSPIVRRTRLSPPREYWASYSYLRLRVKANQPDAPITVVLGAKRYQKTTNVPSDTWVDLLFDLCLPTNATAPYDLQSTMFPDDRVDGDYWGITKTSEMRLELANATWHIDEVSLDVAPWAHRPDPFKLPNHSITICPSRGYWQDTGRGYQVRRFVTGQSDGKLALEIEDVTQTSSSYSILTIADLVNRVSSADSTGAPYWPGWVASYTCLPPTSIPTYIVPLHQYYLTASRPASWIGGAGLIMTANSWSSTARRIQLPAEASTAISIQVLYDEIDWYPSCTDPWGLPGSNQGDLLRILFGTVLRARAFGIVVDSPNKRRFPQGAVGLRRGESEENGGEADLGPWEGYFETGSPFAKGAQVYRLIGIGDASSLWLTSRQYFTRLPLRTVSTVQPALPPLKYFAAADFTSTRIVEAYYDRANERVYVQWAGMAYSVPFESAVISPLTLQASEKPVQISFISSEKTWMTTLDTELSVTPPGVKTRIFKVGEGISRLEMTAITPEGSVPPILCFGYILLLPCQIKVEPSENYQQVVSSGEGLLSGIYRFPELLRAVRDNQNVRPLLRVTPQNLPAWNRNQTYPSWFHRWHWNMHARDFVLLPVSDTNLTVCEIAPSVSGPSDVRKLLPVHTFTRWSNTDKEKARIWANEGRFLILERSENAQSLKGIEGQTRRLTVGEVVSVVLIYSDRNDFESSIILHGGEWSNQGWDLLLDRDWAIIVVGYRSQTGLHTAIWRWGNRRSPPLIKLREV